MAKTKFFLGSYLLKTEEMEQHYQDSS